METNAERRKRKLTDLCQEHGVENVAREAGLSADSLKNYMRGYVSSYTPKKGGSSPSERGLGDPAARAIEDAFKLGRGWFDNDPEDMIATPQEHELLAIFRQFADGKRKLTIQLLREDLTEQEQEAERLAQRLRRPPSPPPEQVHGIDSGLGDLDEAPAAPAVKKRKKS